MFEIPKRWASEKSFEKSFGNFEISLIISRGGSRWTWNRGSRVPLPKEAIQQLSKQPPIIDEFSGWLWCTIAPKNKWKPSPTESLLSDSLNHTEQDGGRPLQPVDFSSARKLQAPEPAASRARPDNPVCCASPRRTK